jgi:hypothetical protein
MIRIPAQKIFSRNKGKLKNKLNNNLIVNSKLVNRKTEPTLFNVESARSTINNTTRVSSTIHEKKYFKTEKNQNRVAMETLFDMNISIVDMELDHSLLETNSEEVLILNPNIVDMKQMNLTLNKNIIATDKFPNSNDPIYQLDEGNFSDVVYVKNQIGKINASNLDVSKIVSDIAIINMSKNNTGINKYFNG